MSDYQSERGARASRTLRGDTVRRAAARMWDDDSLEQSFRHALADWLEGSALAGALGDSGGGALAVASAYLGEG